MRLLLAILMLAFTVVTTPTIAADAATVPELAALCKTERAKCEDQVGVIIMTGVGAQKLPPCTVRLNLPDLTTKVLEWWKAHPDQATGSAVLGVGQALNNIKPC
jgi:hypothetical protein